jgi:hypothetical protein
MVISFLSFSRRLNTSCGLSFRLFRLLLNNWLSCGYLFLSGRLLSSLNFSNGLFRLLLNNWLSRGYLFLSSGLLSGLDIGLRNGFSRLLFDCRFGSWDLLFSGRLFFLLVSNGIKHSFSHILFLGIGHLSFGNGFFGLHFSSFRLFYFLLNDRGFFNSCNGLFVLGGWCFNLCFLHFFLSRRFNMSFFLICWLFNGSFLFLRFLNRCLRLRLGLFSSRCFSLSLLDFFLGRRFWLSFFLLGRFF